MSVASNDFRAVQNQASMHIKDAFQKISWSSIAGGFFVAILSYWFLISLGMGVGAFGLRSDYVDAGTLKALSTFGVIWMVISNSLALLFGGFASMKLSRRQNKDNTRSVLLPSLVLASIYFAVMSMQAVSVVGPAFKSLGYAVSSGSSVLLQQPAVQNLLEDSTAGLRLDGTNQASLAMGIGSRLISGDSTSLKTFIANHSSLSQAEVNLRANQIQSEFRIAAQKFSEATGTALAALAWTMMVTLLLGALASWAGASLAYSNQRGRTAMSTQSY